MAEYQEKLEKILVERDLIKPEQVVALKARAAQEKKTFEEVIRDGRLISSEPFAQVKAEAIGLPYINLASVQRNEAAMANISKQAAATYRFIAYDEKNGKLLIAMESPDDFRALEAVRFIAKKQGKKPDIGVASKEAIDKALGGATEIQAEIGSALRDFGDELEQSDIADVAGQAEGAIERYLEEAPVTKVVAVLIRHAIDGMASDIHIEPDEKEIRIRYRINGALHTSLLLPLRAHSAIVSRVKILSHLKIDESRLPQDGRFSTTTDGRAYDFRVSSMPTIHGEKIVMRILDKSKGAPSFDELGLRGEQQKIFVEHLQSPHGIILISGPTGSGKSTTLFSALSSLNDAAVNISTIEDPVEYEIAGVNQTQTHPDIGLTFASGLRNMLRQDPDIMMVGEIRDKETAALSIHASLTGHLVLSTLHTNDAVGSIPRLVDMGIDPYLLTATLRLLAAQRLVARLCQDCLKEEALTSAVRTKIEEELKNIPDNYKISDNQKKPEFIYHSAGCPTCHETGTTGRLGIFEVVPITRALRQAISRAAEYDILHDTAREQGYITMRQDGILKSLDGQVLFEDVMRVTSEYESL